MNNFDYSGDTISEIKKYEPLFQSVNIILIPKKIEYNLRKYVSKILLKDIDSDINVAIEKCLIIISNLDSTYYTEDKWKNLHSTILQSQVYKTHQDDTYKKCIELLKLGTSTGPMIEVKTNSEGNETYVVGERSKAYKIGDAYSKSGLVQYIIKDETLINRRNKKYFELLQTSFENTIANNLIKVYSKIDLPTTAELLIEGKRLTKNKERSKKGKLYTMRNKNSDSHWKDLSERTFIEDDIEIFQYLTGRGYMIPTVCDENSGERIVDSFTLMPSWIRNMIRINGSKLVECDYTCLHPNIAINLYGGKSEYLNHNKVAEMASIDVKTVKKEHLSFFNLEWSPVTRKIDGKMRFIPGMTQSSLFNFYMENESTMMNKIKEDKKENGYKVTTKKLFKMEVKIMTEVIKRLNAVGVYVVYIYDALMCEPQDEKLVIEVMNEVALEFNVKTRVSNTVITEVVEEEKVTEMASNEARVTIDEFARRIQIKFGSFINNEKFNMLINVMKKFYKHIDEVTDEFKEQEFCNFKINNEIINILK